jgi:hypothetical protein
MHFDDLHSLVFLLSEQHTENTQIMSAIKNIDYLAVLHLANSEFLTSALYYEMKKKNFFNIIEDEKLHAFMHELFVLNTRRNEQILRQLKEIVSTFHSAGVELLLLKGIASLVEQEYEHIGIRYLSDIDLLVHPEDVEKAYALLIAAGYKKVDLPYRIHPSHHHLWPLEKDGMPAMLELHRRAVNEEATAETVSFSTAAAYKIDSNDFPNTWVFKPTYKLCHAFLHTEVDHNYYKLKVLDLRHLYDFTVLAKRYYDAVDWDELDRLIESLGLRENFQSYLYIAKNLFSLTTPLTVDSAKVRKAYIKILKSFELRGTVRGNFYPLFPQLQKMYSRKKMRTAYQYSSDLLYLPYLLKHIVFQMKTYLFCRGCLKNIISRW